jgi:glycosyltransferase involved in cell wall biosynthesis
LEAFAIGCPVLASNIPGAKEQFGDAAVLFSPKNPEEIALKIRILVEDNGLRSSLIARGKIRAEQWTAREYITKVFSFLNEFSHIRKNWP